MSEFYKSCCTSWIIQCPPLLSSTTQTIHLLWFENTNIWCLIVTSASRIIHPHPLQKTLMATLNIKCMCGSIAYNMYDLMCQWVIIVINKYEPGLIYHQYGHTSYIFLLNILYINNVQAYQKRYKTDLLLIYGLDPSQPQIITWTKLTRQKDNQKEIHTDMSKQISSFSNLT